MKPAAAAIAVLLLPPRLACAYALSLNAAQIHAAVEQGARAAREHAGLTEAAYEIFSQRDTLRLIPGERAIDAVLVRTPFERVRVASYYAAFQQQPFTDAQGAALARQGAGRVEFVIFAHSDAEDAAQRDFLSRFHGFTVRANGRKVSGVYTSVFGPAIDNYTTANGVVERWIGTVTCGFDLRSLTGNRGNADRLRGTLSFEDDRGRRYAYPFDLARLL